jgi:uncharacterized membrane protein YsdA (DUF1294 family)
MSGRPPSSPAAIFTAVSLAIVAAAMAAAIYGGSTPLIGYVVGISAATIALYGYDKRAAVKERLRVPEKVLHVLALLGGSPAALLSRQMFRHKTSKVAFRIWFWAIVVVQLVVIAAAFWWRFHPPAWLPEALRPSDR